MSTQTEIRLTNVNVSDPQDINLLIEAANDIQNTTEANFNHMKEKKWYKRLWEIITFSKDNVKTIAKNTASLAQMQDIILKTILMASKESRELSEYLTSNSEQLEEMAKGQAKIANAIAMIKYGHVQRPDISKFPIQHQFVIISSVLSFENKACGEQNVSQLAQQYLRNLRNSCDKRLTPEVAGFDYEKINNLNEDGYALLATILCETSFLLEDSERKTIAFNEVLHFVGIAPKLLEEIKEKTKEYARTMGKEYIADYYAKKAIDDDLFLLDAENIEFEEIVNENKKPSEDDFTLPPDDTENQYPLLRGIVLEHASKLVTDSRDPRRDVKRINAFIKKYSLNVVNETVIVLIDCSITGNGETGLLITTHAMYQRSSGAVFDKPKCIVYKDIVFEKCEIKYNKKGKPSELNIHLINNNTITIDDFANIKLDELLTLLTEIGKLSEYASTDSPQPITKMNYSLKLPFMKYLVNFMIHSKQSTIELMRLAVDLCFSDKQLLELRQYILDPNDSNSDILLQINNNAPYASRKSLKYALILEMYSQLQYVKCSTDINALEHEFINKTAKFYGFKDEDIKNLKVVAQDKYKLITGKIKSTKELKASEIAITTLSLSANIPIATIVGSSFLFLNTAWFFLIPGIGLLLGPVLLGIVIINKNKENAKLKDIIQETISKEAESYKVAINKLTQLFPDIDKDVELLRHHYKQF